ncbi:MFS transporter [Fodinicola feengrottensis]|uniref:MFS transporter n=1 Tax=Fodinicola feengrottensis TaxID=435914 RepID=A0ABN2IC70_9ACTN
MRRVLLLAIGSLALGLDAYVVAGLLPVMAMNLHYSVAALGQLVTAFTLSYALLSPFAAAFFAGRPMRTVLLIALVVFSLGNVLTAVATSLPLLLLARVIAGLGAGIYAPMSAVSAAALVPARRRGRALSLIIGGMTTGVVLGVPLGLLLAHHVGWRATLWMVTGLGVVAMAGVLLALRGGTVQPARRVPVRDRLRVLTDRRVLPILAVTALAAGASIGSYTYLGPLLASTAGVTDLSGYLWLWGLGGLAGSFAIGTLVDRWPNTRLLVTVIVGVLGVLLVSLPAVARGPAGIAVLLVIWGAVGWSQTTPQQHRILALRTDDGPVAMSLNSSALYLGNSLGTAAGGLLLAGAGPAAVVLTFGAIALAVAAANLFTARPTPLARTPAPAATPANTR